MEMVLCIFQTERLIVENGMKVKNMEKEFMNSKIMMFMKDIGEMDRDKEKEFINGLRVKDTMENGLMIK